MRRIRTLCQLGQDEVIQKYVRHATTWLWLRVIPRGIVLCFLSFFLFFLTRFGALFSLLVGILALWMVYGIVSAFIIWDSQALVLTNRRLLFLRRPQLWVLQIQELSLNHVQAIEVIQSRSWRRWIGWVTLRIKGNRNMVFELHAVTGAKPFVDAFTEAKRMVS